MTRPIALLIVAALVLAACGGIRDSRLNPRNWFSASTQEPTLGPVRATLDRRPLVPAVTTLLIERTSTGAIVRAEAVMPTAGYFEPELVAENNGRPVDGVLTYRFVAARPRQGVQVAADAPRTLTAAAVLSVFDLEVVREIVVVGEQGSRRARR